MLGSIKKKDYLHALVIWLILLLWYLIFADAFLSTFQIKLDHFISEQSFWFFNQPPEEAEEITIVAIDEASRRHLNLKWPWKRSVTSELISDIVSFSPAVVGLDIVFSGKSQNDEDEELVSALRSHPKVVLGYVLHGDSLEKPMKDFVEATSSIGFVDKPLQEGIVNQTRTFYVDDEENVAFSLELEILLGYLGLDKTQISAGEQGISLTDDFFVPSPLGITPLNYLVYPSQFNIIPASEVLEKNVSSRHFRDKIVLIGVTDPLIHDEYPTPMGIWPGVTIIANSLAMLLSRRFLYAASPGQNFALAFLTGLLILFSNRKSRFALNTLITFLILGLIGFSLVYLRARGIHFSYLFILFSVTVAYVVPNLYRYLNLLYLSNRLKNLAISDPLTGLYAPRFFLLQLDEKLKLKEDLVFVAIKIGNYKRLTLKLNFEQIKLLSRLFSDHLRSQVKSNFKTSMLTRLSNDTLGIIIDGARKEEVEAFLREFFENTKRLDWELKGERIRISLQGCLINKLDGKPANSDDVIDQMEISFKKTREGQIVVEELEEDVGEERNIRHSDILDFITYDWEQRNKDLEANLKEILEANKRLDQLNWGALTALARAIDAKSKWTAGHSERVTRLAIKIGRVMELTEEELDNLHRAGLLHDIGKIGTPAELIDKAERLTDEDYQILREHPITGARILEPIEAYADVIPIVRQHHESFNGNGYPDGLVGEDITLGARILSIADVFDALISKRPYRAAMPLNHVLQIIKEEEGTKFDPDVVRAFFEVMAQEERESVGRIVKEQLRSLVSPQA